MPVALRIRSSRLLFTTGVAALVALAIMCTSAVAGSRTTVPGRIDHITVTLTHNNIKIPRTPYVLANGVTRYLRGSVIEFTFKNESNRAIKVELAVLGKATGVPAGGKRVASPPPASPIPVGSVRHWTLTFYYRNTYSMRTLINGKIVASRRIVIF